MLSQDRKFNYYHRRKRKEALLKYQKFMAAGLTEEAQSLRQDILRHDEALRTMQRRRSYKHDLTDAQTHIVASVRRADMADEPEEELSLEDIARLAEAAAPKPIEPYVPDTEEIARGPDPRGAKIAEQAAERMKAQREAVQRQKAALKEAERAEQRAKDDNVVSMARDLAKKEK